MSSPLHAARRAFARVLPVWHERRVPARRLSQTLHSKVQQSALQAHHQAAHGRVARRLLLPQHLLQHAQLQSKRHLLFTCHNKTHRLLTVAYSPSSSQLVHTLRGGHGGREQGSHSEPKLCQNEQTKDTAAVDPVRLAHHRHEHIGQVQRDHGRSAVGHTHGVAVWHHGRRGDEEAQHSLATGRRLHLSLVGGFGIGIFGIGIFIQLV